MPRTHAHTIDYYHLAGQTTEQMVVSIAAVDAHLAAREAERQAEPAELVELREQRSQAFETYQELANNTAIPNIIRYSMMSLAKEKANLIDQEYYQARQRWLAGRR